MNDVPSSVSCWQNPFWTGTGQHATKGDKVQGPSSSKGLGLVHFFFEIYGLSPNCNMPFVRSYLRTISNSSRNAIQGRNGMQCYCCYRKQQNVNISSLELNCPVLMEKDGNEAGITTVIATPSLFFSTTETHQKKRDVHFCRISAADISISFARLEIVNSTILIYWILRRS